MINLIKSIWRAYGMADVAGMDFAEDVIYLGQYLQVRIKKKELWIWASIVFNFNDNSDLI